MVKYKYNIIIDKTMHFCMILEGNIFMKKLSKILAVVLSAVFLCGVIAVATSAAPVNPAGTLSFINTDCESSGSYPDGFNATGGFVMSMGRSTGNGYINLTNYVNGEMVPHTSRQIGTLYSIYKFAADNDFITLDFDIMSDKYTNGTDLISIDEYDVLSDSEKEAYTLAYTDMQFYVEVPRLYSGGNGNLLHIKQIDGAWYLSSGNSSTEVYPLPTEAGVWTHVTYVFVFDVNVDFFDAGVHKTVSYTQYQAIADKSAHTDVTATYSSELHIYANGEHAFKLNWGANNVTCPYNLFRNDSDLSTSQQGGTMKYMQIRSSAKYNDSSSRATAPTSFNFDNILMSAYPDGYRGDIVKAIENRDTLLTCNDVVMNSFYEYPAGTSYKAKVISEDNTETYYYLPAAAMLSATTNSTVELFADCNVAVSPKAQFAVKHNGYNVLVDGNSGYILSEHLDDDKYAVRRALYSDYADVVWYYDGQIYDVTRSISGTVPTVDVDLTAFNGVKPGNTYRIFRGWSTDPNATVPMGLPTLTAGDELHLYAVCDTYDTAYLVLDKDGLLFEYNGSYDCYADLKTIGAVVSAAPSGSTVRLLSDVNIAESTPFAFDKSVDVDIDLNGFTLSYPLKGVATSSYMIEVSGKGADITIYSSVPGAKILTYSVGANGKINNAASFINVTSSSSVTIGDGENEILVNTNILYNADLAAGNISLTLNKGTYVSEISSSAALGLIRVSGTAETNFNLDINDATIYAGKIAFNNQGDFKVTADVDSSTIVVAETSPIVARYIIGTINEGSVYTFTDTTLVGKLCLDQGTGKIVLGEGTKSTYDVKTVNNNVVTLAEGCAYATLTEGELAEGTYASFDYTYSAGAWSITEATRSFSEAVLAKVEAVTVEDGNTGTEGDENNSVGGDNVTGGDELTPENNTENIATVTVNNVFTTKQSFVHDAPRSVIEISIENMETAFVGFQSFTEVATVPSKDEEKIA